MANEASVEQKSVEEKKVNPSACYNHPDEVLNDGALTRDEKIAVLREWHYDAVRLQESAAENMTGGESDKLHSVSNALLKLGVEPAAELDPHAPKPSLMNRVLRRIGFAN